MDQPIGTEDRKKQLELVHVCNPSTQQAEAGGLQICSQLGLYGKKRRTSEWVRAVSRESSQQDFMWRACEWRHRLGGTVPQVCEQMGECGCVKVCGGWGEGRI